MDLLPAEGRQCTSCKKTLNLNLFRRDSFCCRYCESGSEPSPNFLKNELEIIDEATSLETSNNSTSLETSNNSTSLETSNNSTSDKN